MREEKAASIEQRYLVIQGLLDSTSLEFVKEGLPKVWNENTICCFISYAYADLPLGKTFELAFRDDLSELTKTLCVVKAVTQQFAKPFDLIPDGWKTITLLEFPYGIPPIIANLPTIHAWGYNNPTEDVYITNEETWLKLKNIESPRQRRDSFKAMAENGDDKLL